MPAAVELSDHRRILRLGRVTLTIVVGEIRALWRDHMPDDEIPPLAVHHLGAILVADNVAGEAGHFGRELTQDLQLARRDQLGEHGGLRRGANRRGSSRDGRCHGPGRKGPSRQRKEQQAEAEEATAKGTGLHGILGWAISPASLPHETRRHGKGAVPRPGRPPCARNYGSRQTVCACPAVGSARSSLGLWASRPKATTSEAEMIAAMMELMSPR